MCSHVVEHEFVPDSNTSNVIRAEVVDCPNEFVALPLVRRIIIGGYWVVAYVYGHINFGPLDGIQDEACLIAVSTIETNSLI